jgi:AbrB family looped-hinge helix DNA binding protein
MAMSGEDVVYVSNRGMITIPLKIREKHGIKPGSKLMFLEIDGAIEIIPYRKVEEMEAACTTSLEQMSRSSIKITTPKSGSRTAMRKRRLDTGLHGRFTS